MGVIMSGATRYRHFLRQMALLAMSGRQPQHGMALAVSRPRSIDETLDELSRRRRRAQMAARRALQL
jgi:hypothetical protein